MQIQTRCVHLDNSEHASQHAVDKFTAALSHFAYRIGAVDVRMDDLHGKRHGTERRCYIRVPINGAGEVIVEHVDPDIYHAIDEAARRVKRAIRRKVNRSRAYSHDKASDPRSLAA